MWRCPYCFGDFDYSDDYCYFFCPFTFECEDEYRYNEQDYWEYWDYYEDYYY